MGVDIRFHHKVSSDTAQAMLSPGYTTPSRCCTFIHTSRSFGVLPAPANLRATLANGWPGRKKLAVACSGHRNRLVATAHSACSKASVRCKCYDLCQHAVNDQSSAPSPAESPAESADEDGSKLHHKNVYGIDKPFGKEEKREDGNYEMSWCVAAPTLLYVCVYGEQRSQSTSCTA